MPSGGARNTLLLPVEPAAPGAIFDDDGLAPTLAQFLSDDSGSASAEPPGGNGTTRVTARDGNLASCAVAAPERREQREDGGEQEPAESWRMCGTGFLLRLDAGFLDDFAP